MSSESECEAAVVIPAFNAATTLPGVIRAITAPQRVVVVDDGSNDATSEIARSLQISVLTHPRNLGVGAALKTGLRWAQAQGFRVAVTLDADGQHDARHIQQFETMLSEAHVVIGQRFVGDVSRVPPAKRVSNLLGSLLVEAVFGRKFVDVSCGFRGIRITETVLGLPDTFAFLHALFFDALISQAPLGTVAMAATYDHHSLLATGAKEILGLATELAHHAQGMLRDEIDGAISRVQRRSDFTLNVAGVEFVGVYLHREDCYLMQADMDGVIKAEQRLRS